MPVAIRPAQFDTVATFGTSALQGSLTPCLGGDCTRLRVASSAVVLNRCVLPDCSRSITA